MSTVVRCGYEIEKLSVGGVGDGGVHRVALLTGTPIRQGEYIVNAQGGVWDAYIKNPVVSWAHDYSAPPIGRAVSVEAMSAARLEASFEFTPPSVYPFADMIRQLWDGGFVNAASLGFDPLEVERPTKEGERLKVQKWEMYEFSLVPVPRDRGALRLALDSFDHAEELLRLAGIAAVPEPKAKGVTLDPQILLDFLKTLKEALR